MHFAFKFKVALQVLMGGTSASGVVVVVVVAATKSTMLLAWHFLQPSSES
jgi:hypothetical protein